MKWTTIHRIAGSWIVRLSVITPFVGYYLLLNQLFIDKFKIHFPAEIDNLYLTVLSGNPAPQNLYISLFIISAGVIVMNIWIPNEMKYYGRVGELVTSEREIQTPFVIDCEIRKFRDRCEFWFSRECNNHINEALAGNFVLKSNEVYSLIAADNTEDLNWKTWYIENQKEITQYLNARYLYLNESFPIARVLCTVLLICGYVLMAIPGIEIFFRIIIH